MWWVGVCVDGWEGGGRGVELRSPGGEGWGRLEWVKGSADQITPAAVCPAFHIYIFTVLGTCDIFFIFF